MSNLCEQANKDSFIFDCKDSELVFQIVKQDQSSRDNLLKLFNPTENPEACKDYGDGKHCTETRVDTKVRIWGGRGEDKDELSCYTARIISINEEPIAMFNIGITGSSPTVIDKSGIHAGKVYDFSGLFMYDALALNFDLKNEISESLRFYMKECIADKGYSKAIITSTSENQIEFMSKSGGIKLTPDNIASLLGENSMHPERFKFENGQFLECRNWNQSQAKISHKDWHDSEPCSEWGQKEMIVFNVADGHIQVHDEI
jgi:hypothetical protein